MSATVNMPVEPIGSGRWTTLAEAEREVRQWAQKDTLRNLVFVYRNARMLPPKPETEHDWYWAWALFDTRWDEADPADQYHAWLDNAWRAYQEGVLFAWQWLGQAISLVKKDAQERAHKPCEACLVLLPPVDPELQGEYRRALRSICLL